MIRYDEGVRTTLNLDDLEPKRPPKTRNGVMVFDPKPGARKPHLALVNQLRDEE